MSTLASKVDTLHILGNRPIESSCASGFKNNMACSIHGFLALSGRPLGGGGLRLEHNADKSGQGWRGCTSRSFYADVLCVRPVCMRLYRPKWKWPGLTCSLLHWINWFSSHILRSNLSNSRSSNDTDIFYYPYPTQFHRQMHFISCTTHPSL